MALILESLSLASAPGLRYLWNNIGLLTGEDLLVHVMVSWWIIENKVRTIMCKNELV